jgi:type VI secretion system protein ImpA
VAVGPVLDINSLLSPIPGDNTAGENLLYSGVHDQIREARRSEDNLEQGEWKREIKTTNWSQVRELAESALLQRTKDLQVSAWLAEALVKTEGFRGLRDSLRLVRGLMELFWDNVYPELEDGDLEARANALSWMDRQVALAIREAPLTHSITGLRYSYLDYQESKRFDIPEDIESRGMEDQEKAAEAKAQAAEEGKITSEQWRMAKNATGRAYYEELNTLLGECWEEFRGLDQVMDARFQRQTPGLGALKKSLEEIRSVVDKVVKEKRVLEPDPVAEVGAPEAVGEGEAGEGAVAGVSGPIRTRQEALRRLAEVSEFFRKTEPHSPVAYLVQRAIRWGEMPLETWLEDVIKDGSVLEQLRETLGIKPTS